MNKKKVDFILRSDLGKAEKVHAIKKLQPWLTNKQLAEKIGCAYGTVVKALNDPSSAVSQKTNQNERDWRDNAARNGWKKQRIVKSKDR